MFCKKIAFRITHSKCPANVLPFLILSVPYDSHALSFHFVLHPLHRILFVSVSFMGTKKGHLEVILNGTRSLSARNIRFLILIFRTLPERNLFTHLLMNTNTNFIFILAQDIVFVNSILTICCFFTLNSRIVSSSIPEPVP